MKKELFGRLRPALSNAGAELLSGILDHVEAFDSTEDGDVLCSFPGESEVKLLKIKAALSGNELSALCDRLKQSKVERFLPWFEVCGGMSWGESGEPSQLSLHGGFCGTLHHLGSGIVNERKFGFAYSTDLFSPIDIGLAAFYFIHPANGRLYLRDEITQVVRDTSDFVEIYLRELCYELRDPERHGAFRDAQHRSDWLMEP